MSVLTKWLGFSAETADQLGEGSETLNKGAKVLAGGAEKIGTATEFLEVVADKLGSADMPSLADAVDAAEPWIESVANIVGEAVPPVKAVLKLVNLLTKETNPRALGLLAFSLAYQSAVAETVKAIEGNPDAATRIDRSVKPRALRRALAAKPDTLTDFDSFKLLDCFNHKLIIRADTMLTELATAVGWPEDLRLLLLEGVHARFRPAFRAVISDGRRKEKFDPLFRFMEIDGREASSFAAIARHIAYQLWRFNQAPIPILGQQPSLSLRCSLRDIYIHWTVASCAGEKSATCRSRPAIRTAGEARSTNPRGGAAQSWGRSLP